MRMGPTDAHGPNWCTVRLQSIPISKPLVLGCLISAEFFFLVSYINNDKHMLHALLNRYLFQYCRGLPFQVARWRHRPRHGQWRVLVTQAVPPTLSIWWTASLGWWGLQRSSPPNKKRQNLLGKSMTLIVLLLFVFIFCVHINLD